MITHGDTPQANLASMELLNQLGYTRIAVPRDQVIKIGSQVQLVSGNKRVKTWVTALIREGEEVPAIDGLEGDQPRIQRVTIATLSLQRGSPCLH